MRTISIIPLALFSIAGLAACQSEDAFRAEARVQALRNCEQGDPAAKAQLVRLGVDIKRFCTCVIDRYMRTATYEQLKRDARSEDLPPGMRAELPQCAAEQGLTRGAGRNPAATGDAARARAEADRALSNANAEAQRALDEANADIENAMRQ